MVHREMDATDPLAALLVRSALTTGVDTRIRFTGPHLRGDGQHRADLPRRRAGRDRARAAGQRPLPPAARSARRFATTRRVAHSTVRRSSANLGKIAGRHWLWDNNIMIESPEFDPLDFGRLNYAGDLTGGTRVTYRETRPGRYVRAYSFQGTWTPYWYFDTDLGVRHNLRQQQQRYAQQLLGGHGELHAVFSRPGCPAHARRAGHGNAARVQRVGVAAQQHRRQHELVWNGQLPLE